MEKVLRINWPVREFEGESSRTGMQLPAGVSIKGEGEARPSDGCTESAIYFDKLIKNGHW